MSKRDKARSDAAFHAGKLGVDGQATEEKADVEAAERGKAREQFLKGRAFLGRELLTWLLWQSESSEPLFEQAGEKVSVLFGGRLALRGLAGEVTEIVAKGAMAPYSALVRTAMDRGLLVHQARVKITWGEREFEATLDADYLDVRSAKLPELLKEADDDRISERLDLVEQLTSLIDALVDRFLALRTGKRWSKEIVPAMKEWLAGEVRREAPRKATASPRKRASR
jgi:hypothetical protein